MNDLKTCPFCGAPALLEFDDSPGKFPYTVVCGGNACPISSVCVVGKTQDEVISRWNRRVRPECIAGSDGGPMPLEQA